MILYRYKTKSLSDVQKQARPQNSNIITKEEFVTALLRVYNKTVDNDLFDESKLNDIISYVFVDSEDDDIILRKDLIMTTLKLLGFTEKGARSLSNVCFYVPIYSDECNYGTEYYSFLVASGYNHISKENYDECSDDGRYVKGDTPVTVAECLEIFVNGLTNTENMDEEHVYQFASEKGLLRGTDVFFEKLETQLDKEDFEILLKRMLNQKVCGYFKEDNYVLSRKPDFDQTYFEFLLSR